MLGNRTWNSEGALHACVWVQCLDPPKVLQALKFSEVNQNGFVHFQPPNEYNLVTNWSGFPVEFYSNVSYNCASPDLHFEADFDQLSWDGALCLSNGSWQLVDNWPSCLKSKSLWLTLLGNEPYIVQTMEKEDDVFLPIFQGVWWQKRQL